MHQKIWVIIPAKNEAQRIGSVIDKAKKYIKNILVVDDGSTDSTYDVANQKKVVVLKHIVNLGKGAALKTGCDFAIKNGADVLIAIDADGQHEPDEIPNFLKALEEVDVVFGYRIFSKDMPFIFKFGNSFINLATKLLYGLSLRDTQSGYRAFTAEAYKKVRWKASDYSMESEMIANLGKAHLRYKEIPVPTIYLDRYKGTTLFDGLKIVFNMVLWRFGR